MQETQEMWFNPCVGKIPGRGKWQPIPVVLPENLHGQRSLERYSPQSPKESVITEHAHTCHLQSEKKIKKKKPTFHISMKTLFRILNSFLLMTYLQYLFSLFHWEHLLWFSPFLPKRLVISLSFHICRFRFRWPMLVVAANGAPYAWVNIWYHEIAKFGEQRGAGSQISFQLRVLGMNLTNVIQREKAKVRWLSKTPTSMTMPPWTRPISS